MFSGRFSLGSRGRGKAVVDGCTSRFSPASQSSVETDTILVLYISKNWGGYSSGKLFFNNLLDWSTTTSPKFDSLTWHFSFVEVEAD
jgi:hypothetical protein